MLKLNDGRSELWQWDTGRKLTVDAECSQVHFSNKVFGRSIDMPVIDGVVEIPDFILQTDKDLTAWAFVGTTENGYTKISKVFKVNKRNKPADYVFTPPEQTTLGEIMERLDLIEESQDPDAIKNAVDDYLASNPIKVEETDPTVPDWAKQPEPPKVEIPEVNIPATLPNPHHLTFTGAVEATYDGSKPVEVAIPQGGGSAEWAIFADITTTEGVGIIKGTIPDAAKEVLIFFKCPAVETSIANVKYGCWLDDSTRYTERRQWNYIDSGHSHMAQAHFTRFGDMFTCLSGISGRYGNVGDFRAGNGYDPVAGNTFIICSPYGNINFPIGTTVKAYWR